MLDISPKEKAEEIKLKVMESQGSSHFYPTDRKTAIYITEGMLNLLSNTLQLKEDNKYVIYWNEVRDIFMNKNETITKV